MDLSTTQQVLLVILSSALAIFIILAIVVAVLAIRLLQALRLIADRAERVMESASHLGDIFKSVSGPMGIFKFVRGIIDMAHHKDSKKDKE